MTQLPPSTGVIRLGQDGRTSIQESEVWGAEVSEAILRECLETFPHIRMRVTGNCMIPDLCPGDTVSIVSRTRRLPRWGDIVLVRLGDGMRLHRLVWRWPFASERRLWLTKPDRSAVCDPRVSHADLLGIVVAIEGASPGRRSPDARLGKTLSSLVTGLVAWARIRLLAGRSSA